MMRSARRFVSSCSLFTSSSSSSSNGLRRVPGRALHSYSTSSTSSSFNGLSRRRFALMAGLAATPLVNIQQSPRVLLSVGPFYFLDSDILFFLKVVGYCCYMGAQDPIHAQEKADSASAFHADARSTNREVKAYKYVLIGGGTASVQFSLLLFP